MFVNRDRINTGSKDIFTECGKLDDQELKKDIQTGIEDPLVDITGFEDKTLEEGFGNLNEKVAANPGNVHQSMIKRFNQHSIMVGINNHKKLKTGRFGIICATVFVWTNYILDKQVAYSIE